MKTTIYVIQYTYIVIKNINNTVTSKREKYIMIGA